MIFSGFRISERPPQVPTMPPGLVKLMEGLARDVLKHNPSDVDEFCANHMHQLLEIRDGPSKNKPLSLKRKIMKAQEKVRQRAEQRRQKFDRQVQVQSTQDPDECTISSDNKGQMAETRIQSALKAPIRHDHLTHASEVEISHDSCEESITAVETNANILATNDLVAKKDVDVAAIDSLTEKKPKIITHVTDIVDIFTQPHSLMSKDLNEPPKVTLHTDEENNETSETEVGNKTDTASPNENLDIVLVSDDSLPSKAGCDQNQEQRNPLPNNLNLPKSTDEQNASIIDIENFNGTPDEIEIVLELDLKSDDDNNCVESTNHQTDISDTIRANTAEEHSHSLKLDEVILGDTNDGDDIERKDVINIEKPIKIDTLGSVPEEDSNDLKTMQVSLEHGTTDTQLDDNCNRDTNIKSSDNTSMGDSDNIFAVEVKSGEMEKLLSNSGDKEKWDAGVSMEQKLETADLKDSDSVEKTMQDKDAEEKDKNDDSIRSLLNTELPKTNNGIETVIDDSQTSLIGELVEAANVDNDRAVQNGSQVHELQANPEGRNQSNMDLETAAITIQKVFRTFLFKSRASTFDDTANDAANLSDEDSADKEESEYLKASSNLNLERRPLGISRMDTVLQTVNEEKSLSLSTDDSSTLSSAATTIQAHVRGFLVRNKLNSSKNVSTNSLVNSNTSLDNDIDHHKNKTILNIHIVPEGGNLSRDESIITSMDLSLDGSPPSSINLHPLGYDKSERRKLKREDAIQSISPPSNNSGKLSEESEIKDEIINDLTDSQIQDMKVMTPCNLRGENDVESRDTSECTTPITVINTQENQEETSRSASVDSKFDISQKRELLVKMSSDEMDVVTPSLPSDERISTPLPTDENGQKLEHSGEFHDMVLPTRVSRCDTAVVRGE